MCQRNLLCKPHKWSCLINAKCITSNTNEFKLTKLSVYIHNLNMSHVFLINILSLSISISHICRRKLPCKPHTCAYFLITVKCTCRNTIENEFKLTTLTVYSQLGYIVSLFLFNSLLPLLPYRIFVNEKISTQTTQTCHCVWDEVLPEGGTRYCVVWIDFGSRYCASKSEHDYFFLIWNDLRYNFTVYNSTVNNA